MKKIFSILIILLSIFIICFISFIFCNKILNKNNTYNYNDLCGVYEFYDFLDSDNQQSLTYQMYLFDDGYFYIIATRPYSINIGNYLINDNTLILNYYLHLSGGYPQSIETVKKKTEFEIKSTNLLIDKTNNYQFKKNNSINNNELEKFNLNGEYKSINS